MDENRYFDYLCAEVGRSQDYSILLDELHRIEFYSLIPNDDNRGIDGAHLRELFLDDVGGHTRPSTFPHFECTVFEMLIGLAFRLEVETLQSKWEKRPREWFWILIDNLGLIDCDNESCLRKDDYNCTFIKEIINRFLSRDYSSDGNGGLFPLRYPKKDQRRVEIWYQMSAYILENYPI